MTYMNDIHQWCTSMIYINGSLHVDPTCRLYVYVYVYMYLFSLGNPPFIDIRTPPTVGGVLDGCFYWEAMRKRTPYSNAMNWIKLNFSTWHFCLWGSLPPGFWSMATEKRILSGGRGYLRLRGCEWCEWGCEWCEWGCEWYAAGWRTLIGSPKLQIIFHKRATKYSTFVYIYAVLRVLMIWAHCFFLLTCLFFLEK